MSEREIQYEDFNCSKLGEKVKITREILVHHRSTSAGEIEVRSTASIDCDHKSDCGVGISTGPGMIYDWNKCAHTDFT